jgi:class 3 adenylate cyclase/tetratricopeptide (TPR) repeat protein
MHAWQNPPRAVATPAPLDGGLGDYTPRHLAEDLLTTRAARDGERKHVTVVFCDIADSTVLAERLGPDRMHAAIDAFFELALEQVHRFGGTINQFLGDGFMALFGAPVAHEDHAQRAVLAAAAVRNSAAGLVLDDVFERGLAVRMGLNSGLVIVGVIGNDLRRDYTAVGTTTNIAARLQALAEPGTILLSEATRRAAPSAACRDLGTRALKGVADRVAVYELVEAFTPCNGDVRRERIESPLVGRESELGGLRRAIGGVSRGSGAVVVVAGDVGVGKSRLVEEARTTPEAVDVRWLEGRGISFGRTMRYWPFLELIRAAAEVHNDDSDVTAWRKLETYLLGLFGSGGRDFLPYLGALLSLRPGGRFAEHLGSLDPRALGGQILLSTRRLFERLASIEPLVLVFEDLQWFDQSSTELLEHIVPLVDEVPLCIIGTVRADGDRTAASDVVTVMRRRADSQGFDLNLSPLGHREATDLLDNLIGSDALPRSRAAALLAKAEGNPFFLEEVVREWVSAGVLVRDSSSGGWRSTPRHGALCVPDTVQDVIMARVDRLDEELKDVLKLAAVIGRSFFYRILDAITHDPGALTGDLVRLERVELIRKRRRLPELEYIFKHNLVQETTYESILLQRRRELHLRAAQAVEEAFVDRLPEFYAVLAHHYARANDRENARHYLLAAGAEAARVAADAEALAHYEQALAASEDAFTMWTPLERARLQREIGGALLRRGDHERAVEYLHRALLELGRPYPASRLALRAAIARELLRQLGRQFVRRSWAQPSPDELAGAAEACRVYYALSWIDYFSDHERLALDALLTLNVAEPAGLPLETVRGAVSVAIAFDLLPIYGLAARFHEQALAVAERHGDPAALAFAYLGRGVHEYSRGNCAEALHAFTAAADAGRDSGDVRAWAGPASRMAWLLRLQGDHARSLDVADEVTRIGRDTGDSVVLAWGLQERARTLWHLGRFDEASSLLNRAREVFEAAPDPVSLAHCLSDIGLCHLRRGELEPAIATLERSRELITAYRLRGDLTSQTYVGLAECLVQLAEVSSGADRKAALKRARRATRAALRHARFFPEAAPGGHRARGNYDWLRGRRRAALRHWHRSLLAAEQVGARSQAALTEAERHARLGSDETTKRATSNDRGGAFRRSAQSTGNRS